MYGVVRSGYRDVLLGYACMIMYIGARYGRLDEMICRLNWVL